MALPDRLTPLIRKLESGQPLTTGDIHRTHQLQALDLLKLGQDFVDDALAREQAAVQHMQDVHDASAKELGV